MNIISIRKHIFETDIVNDVTYSKVLGKSYDPLRSFISQEKIFECVCIPILVTTFPEWLSGTEPLPHTPGDVRPSTCL